MSPTDSRKFFDVSPPGKAAASPTSRPVIAKPPVPDPFLHQTVSPPLQARPQLAPAEPIPATTLDPTALLIQAGDFTPLKASRSSTRHIALVAMILSLVILCAVTYWLVSTM